MKSDICIRLCLGIIFILGSLSACVNPAAVISWPDGLDRESYLQILDEKPAYAVDIIKGNYPSGSPVARYGTLKVVGTQLCNERGNPVQLCGLFLRALKEEHKYLNRDAFAWMVEKWKIDVFRIPFFPARWFSEPSYINRPFFEQKIHDVVRLCEEFGIYCVIDWHILGDGNPFQHAEEARTFFRRMAHLYSAKKHVIFEICNEPNGKEVTWDAVIKPYAELMIPVIRAEDPDAVVIVGTGTWCQAVHAAAANPLSFKNILYAFHFYSGTHKQQLRDRVNAVCQKIPLFASEWGNSDAWARGGPYVDESMKWLEFMRSRKISWCHYALTNFDEGAAMLRPHAFSKGGWENNSLTPSGKFIVNYLKSR